MTPLDQALLRSRRHRLLQQARGRVLELGGAGGVNFEHYRAAEITSVMVVGAEGPSRARLVARRPGGASPASRWSTGARSTEWRAASTPSWPTFTLSARGDLERDLRTLAALAGAGRAPAVPRSQPSPRARSGHGAEPAALAAPGRRLRGRAGPAGGATDLRLHDRRHRALRAGDADPPATVLRGGGGPGAAPGRRPQDRGEGERRAVTGTLALIGGGRVRGHRGARPRPAGVRGLGLRARPAHRGRLRAPRAGRDPGHGMVRAPRRRGPGPARARASRRLRPGARDRRGREPADLPRR